MAEPTQKSEMINHLLNTLSGTNREEQIRNNRCTWCKGPAQEFRDEASRQEYRISGLCQQCQDETFGV